MVQKGQDANQDSPRHIIEIGLQALGNREPIEILNNQSRLICSPLCFRTFGARGVRSLLSPLAAYWPFGESERYVAVVPNGGSGLNFTGPSNTTTCNPNNQLFSLLVTKKNGTINFKLLIPIIVPIYKSNIGHPQILLRN